MSNAVDLMVHVIVVSPESIQPMNAGQRQAHLPEYGCTLTPQFSGLRWKVSRARALHSSSMRSVLVIAAVVARAGLPLRVLVREARSQGLDDRLGREVL